MDARLRIVHVLAPADVGGLERVVGALARGQRARGHDVLVWAVVDEGRETAHPVVRDLRADGIEVVAVAVPPRAYRAERRALRELIGRFAPSVVHVHGARADVVDLPVALRARVPTVTTLHGFTGGGLKNRFYEYLQRRAVRGADAVVAVSTQLASTLAASGVRATRLHTVPNAWAGGDVLRREEARGHLGMGDVEGPLIGWVGRLTREKGADVLLEAMARLEHPTAVAIMVGTGPECASLERRAARLGLGARVRWAGSVPAAGSLLSAFDVFAMSSRTEGTPIALFEAIAAGVPVVATAVGGVPHVVGRGEALVIPPENPGALAAAIRDILTDPVAARARAAAAQARLATEFALEPWLDRYEAVYRSAAQRRQRAATRDGG